MQADYRSAHHLREAKRQQHLCACLCLWCSILSVTILLICITVGLRYSGSRDELQYSSTVGDTRLVSYSPALCTGGQMSISVPGYRGGMYFLDEEPPLSTWNILWLTGSFVIEPYYVYDYYDFYATTGVYVTWVFHLNPGSSITTRSCLSNDIEGAGANFAVIQGSHEYNRWIGSYSGYEATLDYCGSGANPRYTFNATENAYYSVVYYATIGAPKINLFLTINRTEYSPADFSGMPNCTLASNGTCTAESQSSSRYILFQTTTGENNITQVQQFTLNWKCYSRDGVYVVFFFFPLIILGLLFCGCFGIYCLCARFCCHSSYTELGEDHTHVHAQPVCEKKPPPPYSAGPL